MAGSYKHVVTKTGKLRSNESLIQMIENLGDAYEAIEEMYGMIWYLADGDAEAVERARLGYKSGLAYSPGVQA